MAFLKSKKTLTLAAARAVAEAAEKFASEKQLNVVIAVLDDGANLLCLARMDDAPLCSIAIAQQKARTSVIFKSPSKDFQSGVAAGNMSLLTLDVLAFEGGLPLLVDGELAGAIGVSGATAPEDGEVAMAGVRAFADILSA